VRYASVHSPWNPAKEKRLKTAEHIYITFGIKAKFQYQGKNEKFSRSHVRTASEHSLWIGAKVEI